MLTALIPSGEKVLALDAGKGDGPFICSECCGPLTLRKGEVRIHHFAHTPPFTCQYGSGETEAHLRSKIEIHRTLKNLSDCSKCELERSLSGVRPDVSLYIGKIPVAIEIQNSRITVDEIVRRMKRYTELRIHVVWVIPSFEPKSAWREKEKTLSHRAIDWELFLQAMYFGRIYYHRGEDLVRPYHFGGLKLFREVGHWFDGAGNEWYGGGYEFYSRGFKRVEDSGKDVSLATGFKSVSRPEPFDIGTREIPPVKIWVDKGRRWW